MNINISRHNKGYDPCNNQNNFKSFSGRILWHLFLLHTKLHKTLRNNFLLLWIHWELVFIMCQWHCFCWMYKHQITWTTTCVEHKERNIYLLTERKVDSLFLQILSRKKPTVQQFLDSCPEVKSCREKNISRNSESYPQLRQIIAISRKGVAQYFKRQKNKHVLPYLVCAFVKQFSSFRKFLTFFEWLKSSAVKYENRNGDRNTRNLFYRQEILLATLH